LFSQSLNQFIRNVKEKVKVPNTFIALNFI